MRSLVFLISLTFLVACSSDSGSGGGGKPQAKNQGQNSSENELQGLWSTPCVAMPSGGGYAEQWFFKGNEFNNTKYSFESATCDSEAQVGTAWKGTFVIKGAFGNGGLKKIDLHATDLGGAQTTMYNVYRVQGQTLEIGNYADVEDQRPSSIEDYSTKFEKIPFATEEPSEDGDAVIVED